MRRLGGNSVPALFPGKKYARWWAAGATLAKAGTEKVRSELRCVDSICLVLTLKFLAANEIYEQSNLVSADGSFPWGGGSPRNGAP